MRLSLLICAFSMILSFDAHVDSPAPRGEPPQFWRASAVRKDGEVIVQITRPTYVAPRKAVFPEAMQWESLRPVAIGESAQLFHVDGTSMKPHNVLKAFAEPKGLAVAVQYGGDKLIMPDHFYLTLLHPDTYVLIVRAGEILDLRP